MKFRFHARPRLIALFAVVIIASAYAQISNVRSRSAGGDTVFYDGATNIMTIKGGTDGVDFHQTVSFEGAVDRAPLVTISDNAGTTTPVTITAAQNGTHFVLGENGSNPLTFNLPAAVAGMEFWFTDNDATADADLVVNPDDADTIEDSSAGVSINSTTDEVGPTLGLRAVSSTQWVVIGVRGTWAEGS